MKLVEPEILNDSILFFAGAVDENDSSSFPDHSELLNYLSDRILPICDKPDGYIFIFDLSSEKNTGRCVLTSLLKMAQIKCCSNVRIRIFTADETELPVREISNWLHRKCDGQRERSLFINFSIKNALEMFNHLKKVRYIICHFFILSCEFQTNRFCEIFKNTF